MSDHGKAVFLSYASQDAEAAKRICEALRAAGVEVWFDQSELVGGDQWDGKIRGQISSCALFLPIISASTQARLEGYFRIEWKLAARRTHAMASAKAFLLPLVIDDISDASAHVPDEFRDVQWTRLRLLGFGEAGHPDGDQALVKFVTRVKKLLGGEDSTVGSDLRRDGPTESGHKSPPKGNRPGRSKWWWSLPIFGVAMALALVLKEGRKNPLPVTPIAETAATKTIARVTAMLYGIDVTRAELDLASELLAQAVKADPADARLIATWAMVDCRYLTESYDQSPSRFDAARRHAAQASSLDGGDPLVRLARAFTMQQVNDNPATRAEATALLETIRTELPGDPRVLHQLGWVTDWTKQGLAKAEDWWAQQAKLPGQAAAAAFNRGLRRTFGGDFRAGYAALAEADALGKSTKVKLWKSYLEVVWLGDLAAAKRTMAEVPAEAFVEDMPASARYFVAYWSRDFELALTASRAVPREFLQSNADISPTGYIRGMALARLGRTAAAENEWRAALAVTERRLASEPSDQALLLAKGLLLVALGDKPAAAQIRRMAIELHGENARRWSEDFLAAELLPAEEAITRLQDIMHRKGGWITAATLRLNPYYDHFRDNPRFVALQAEADADPKLSPTVKAASAPSPASSLLARPELVEGAPSARPEVEPKSVAVLAFANLSDDKANEYFSDGISEELLNVLAKVPGLKVSARTSAFYFKGKDTPIPEIARQLGVAYVIEGSVRKSGDKVRITAQLIKTDDGFHVWSDTFTRDLKDIFAVQDEIAGLIAQQLQLKFSGAPARDQKVNPEAHQLYLQGRYFANQPSTANLAKAVDFLQRAVDLDPSFAPAWGALGRNVALHAEYLETTPESLRESFARARRAADRAIALAPKLPDGYFARLEVQTAYDYDWAGARDSLDTALALAPADALLISNASQLATQFDQVPRSLELGRRAAELDPVNAEIRYWLGRTYLCAGLLAEGEAELRRAAELSPFLLSVHRQLAIALVLQGRAAEGVVEARLEKDEWSRQAALAIACWAAKDVRAADAALARLIEVATESAAYQVGEAYAFRGEADAAFQWLDRAYRNRDSGFGQLRVDPLLKGLHRDPRWVPLLKQAGLADEQLK